MSRDYNNIVQSIQKTNEQLYQKDMIVKEIADIKRDIKIISMKIDKIYKLILDMSNNGEY
jgi:K+/H+ antiporter YhaU regulatory subunit KhtT